MDKPIFEHDCTTGGCKFLGHDAVRPGEGSGNIVDLYVHIGQLGATTVIRRLSSEPSDYRSFPLFPGYKAPPGFDIEAFKPYFK